MRSTYPEIGMMALAATLSAGCTVSELPEPEAGTYEWTTYTNEAAGFTMEVPNVYDAREEAGGRAALFRWDGGVPVKTYWTTAEEAEHRGLWFEEAPAGRATLGGVDGQRYEYDHCDGPICSRMVSFVVPWQGRQLALEFRSDGELNATNRHILESFEVLQTEAAASP